MRALAALVLVLAAGPAVAEVPLTAEAFDALTLGQTMTWSEYGKTYGVEQYLPDRRVRWTFTGDACINGYWYPEGDAIRFKYEDRTTPACWLMGTADSNLSATDTDNGPGVAPIILNTTSTPLACFDQDVGV